MDWTAIVASVVTGLLSIGAVSMFFKNNMGRVIKYAMLAKDAVETLSDVAEALKDGALSPDEITELKNDVIKFKADLQA